MSAEDRGLLDTSVFIGRESGRELGSFPLSAAVSVATIAELHLGVLMASDQDVRARRLRTLAQVKALFHALPIDDLVATRFAEIAAESRSLGRRPKVMDLWIAATAAAHDLTIYTQDQDFLTIPQIRVAQL